MKNYMRFTLLWKTYGDDFYWKNEKDSCLLHDVAVKGVLNFNACIVEKFFHEVAWIDSGSCLKVEKFMKMTWTVNFP